MFKYKNKYCSEAGYLLKFSHGIMYDTTLLLKNFNEVPIDLDSAVLENNYIKFSTHIMMFYPNFKYEDWKKHIIQWRYSNDDQIAIMLNKDDSEEDKLQYEKMQEWREWASKLAKKIIQLKDENSNT